MAQTDFYNPLSVKGREFLRRPVPAGLTTISTQIVPVEDDDSWIYDSTDDLPEPVVAGATTRAHTNKGGRPKGATKKRTPTVHILKVTSQESAEAAVLDILWRAKRNAELVGALGRRKLTAKQVVSQMELSGVSERQVYGIINRMVSQGSVEHETKGYCDRQGKFKRKELIWLDSPRQGWYWNGSIWSERELAKHPHCKVARNALRYRLHIQGLSVDKAMRGIRSDNALKHSVPIQDDEEWTVI